MPSSRYFGLIVLFDKVWVWSLDVGQFSSDTAPQLEAGKSQNKSREGNPMKFLTSVWLVFLVPLVTEAIFCSNPIELIYNSSV